MANWMDEFTCAGALWLHDGQPARPHALLTSGLHSDGFVNCSKITEDPALLRRILTAPDGLSPKLSDTARGGAVDWVIGSALGAVTFAYAVAERLGARAGFTEKEGEGMKLARFGIPSGARVLVVEDVISTGGSTLKTIAALEAGGGKSVTILPFIICLVNRSGTGQLGGREVRALLEPKIATWKPEECPLCKIGSEALRPKNHWKDLTGQ